MPKDQAQGVAKVLPKKVMCGRLGIRVKVLGGEVMVLFFAMNLWRWKCGLPEITLNERLEMKEQWSKQFEVLMRHRLEVGVSVWSHRPGNPGTAGWSRRS